MKRTTLICTWAATIVIASASGAVGAQRITGRSIEDGSLTSSDIQNGSVGPQDLTPTVNRELRGPIVHNIAYQIPAGDDIGRVTLTCPAGTAAVNGGIRSTGAEIDPADYEGAGEPAGRGNWALTIEPTGDEMPPIDASLYVICD